jgi:hypothetical protein
MNTSEQYHQPVLEALRLRAREHDKSARNAHGLA